MIIPLPPYAPDRTDHAADFSDDVSNVIPAPDGWAPMESFAEYSSDVGSAVIGAWDGWDSDGNRVALAATATHIYRLETDGTWTDKSGATYAADKRWSFAQFGDNVIACNGVDNNQVVDITTSNSFADLGGSPPIARHVHATGDFLFLSDIPSAPNTTRWSGLNDITHWVKGRFDSDEKYFPTGGKTLAVVDAINGGYVIQERAINPMIINPAISFPDSIPTQKGASAPFSIVEFNGTFAYLSEGGFFMGPNAQEIGFATVNKTVMAEIDPHHVSSASGAYDFARKIVWWSYRTATGEDKMVGFDWQLNRWTIVDDAPDFLLTTGTQGVDIDSFGALGFNIDTIPFSLDSDVWKGGRPVFGGFKNNKLGFYNGPAMAAEINTADVKLAPSWSFVIGTMAMIDTASHTVSVGCKSYQHSTMTMGADNSPEASTNITPCRAEGGYHRFRLKVPAGETWSVASGIDIPANNIQIAGDR